MSMDQIRWLSVLRVCGVAPDVAARWAPTFAAECQPESFSAGAEELPEFLGQILHESERLQHTVESLNYSTAERIRAVWPRRFPTVADAAPYVRNPVALGDRVYGGRMGNRAPGDGHRYRGRGLIMCTGRDGYAALGALLGVDLVAAPELLEQSAMALRGAVAWWEERIPDSILRDADIVAETRRVNGGTIGLADRQALTMAARRALGCG